MAKLNQITIGGKLAIEVNADPSAGLIAPIGSFALFSDAGVGKLYLKVGASDTSWSLVTTDGAIDLTPYLKRDGSLPMTGDLNVATNDIVAATSYNSYVVDDTIFTDDAGSLLMTFGSETSDFPFKLSGSGTPPSNLSFDVVYYAIVVTPGVYHVSNTGFPDTLLSYIDSGSFTCEAFFYTLGEMSLRASQVNLENHKIVGIANAVNPQDVPSLSQVEGLISAIPSVDLEPFLKHDGSVPMTGDFDFAGFEAVAVSEISHFKKFTEEVAWNGAPFTKITLGTNHPMAERQGAPCKFTVGSILPPEFDTSTTYYAKTLNHMDIQLEASVGGGIITYSLGGGLAYLEFLGSDLKVSSDLNLQSNKIKNLIDPVSAQDASTKNYADTRDALYLPLEGGTMSDAIAMGTHKITGLDNGTLPDHAINLSQLQAAIGGLFWLNPCLDPDLVDDSAVQATVEALPPVSGDVYIASASGSTWVSGHAYFWDSSAWVDLLGRAVQAGDRFGVSVETATIASSGLFEKDNFVAEILSIGPIVWSFHSPNDQEAFFVNNELSTHFGHSYTYFSNAWIEFGGISALNAGAGLDLSGNILSVNCGAGIKILSDEVVIDLYSASALELVDPSTGLPSVLTDAQLSLKLDSIGYATLSKSTDGIRVANGGIKNTQVASDASIAYSKLDLALSIVNGDVSTSAAIAFSKLASLTEAHILVGSATGVATDVAMSGEASIIASGAVTLSNSAVIAKTLTAYTAGAGVVSSADSILSAIQKLDGNIQDLPAVIPAWKYIEGSTAGLNDATAHAYFGTVSGNFDISICRNDYAQIVLGATQIQISCVDLSSYVSIAPAMAIVAEDDLSILTLDNATGGIAIGTGEGTGVVSGSLGFYSGASSLSTGSVSIYTGDSDTINSGGISIITGGGGAGAGNIILTTGTSPSDSSAVLITTKRVGVEFLFSGGSLATLRTANISSPTDAIDAFNLVLSAVGSALTRTAKISIFLNGDTYSAVWEKVLHIDALDTLVLVQDSFSSLNTASASVTVAVSMSGSLVQLDFLGLLDTGMTIKAEIEGKM